MTALEEDGSRLLPQLQRTKAYHSIHERKRKSRNTMPGVPKEPTKACSVAEIENDVWDVKALEFYIEPVSEPSAAIERLLESRYQRHEETKSEMCKQVMAINDEAELWIRRNSEVLRIMLRKLDKVMKVIEIDLQSKEILELQKDDFDRIWKDVMSLFLQRRDIVDIYCQKLMTIEHNRSKRVTLVFREHMKKLNKISHYLPYEVQEFFEHEILRYNQTLLNNIRCYADTHLHFIASGDLECLELKRRVNYLQYEWKEAKKKAALLKFEEDSEEKLKDPIAILEEEEAQKLRAELSGLRDQSAPFESLVCHWADRPNIPYTSDNVREWSTELIRTIMHLDSCARRIIHLYRKAVVQVLAGIDITLETIQLEFIEESLFTTQDINEMQIMITPIINRIKRKQENQLLTMEETWNDVMSKMLLSIQVTQNFLTASANIWERHFERLDKSVKLVAACLDKKIEDNAKLTQNLEVKFNVELELLRQESNELKLKKALEKVYKCLDAIQDTYNTCLASEIAVIRNYPQLVTVEYAVLAAEMEQFMVTNPIVESEPELKDSQIELPVTESPAQEKMINREMKMCMLRLDAIENWKLGLWEGMRRYISSNYGDVVNEAEMWVETMLIQANERIETKIAFHMPRYQRVKLEIYNVRLAEMNLHASRVNSHKLGLEKCGVDMISDLSNLVENQNQLINDLLQNLLELEQQVKEAIRSAAVVFHMKKLETEVGKITSNIQRVMSEFREECVSKIDWIKATNVNFMNAVTMFSEAGSFSSKEAAQFVNELQGLDKQIDKHAGTLTKQVDSEKSTLLKNVKSKSEKILVGMRYIHDDLLFSERAVETIKKLQANIKKEVCSMKSDSKSLNHKIADINTVLVEKTVPASSLFENWNELIEVLRKRRDYLVVPIPELDNTDPRRTFVQTAPVLTFTTFEIDPSKIPTLRRLSADNRYVDYREFLYNSQIPPPDNDNFLSRVCLSMWNVFGQIQEIARLFYTNKGSRPVAKKDIIQPDYNRFIEEVLVKFKYYHVQCEEVWLDQVQEFLVLITKTRQLANSYVRTAFEEFSSGKVGELTGIQSRFNVELAVKSKEQDRHRTALDNKLLPLYGYPGNSQMLENLNAEVLNSFQLFVAEALDFFVVYKELLSNTYSTYQAMLDETVEPLIYVTEKMFDPDWTPQLAQQLEDVCTNVLDRNAKPQETEAETAVTLDEDQTNVLKQRIHDIVHNENVPVASYELIAGSFKGNSIPQLHKLSIDYSNLHAKRLLNRLNNLRQETLRIAQLEKEASLSSIDEEKNVVDEEQDAVDEEREASEKTLTLSVDELVNLLKPLDIEEMATNAAKYYNDLYSEYCHGLNKEVIKYKGLSKEWIRNWKISVKEVKQLYTVTYDTGSEVTPPPQPLLPNPK